MQFRHLEYFVATADHGSASAAALATCITQPALSRQLRQLERDLGVDLFDRTTGRLVLSRVGRQLLPAARLIIQSAEALQAAARFHAQGTVDRLVIAAPMTTLTDVVSPFVATTTAEDPVIDVRITDGLTTADALQRGADLAIGTHRPGPPFQSRVLAELPVWAYVRSDDPWCDRSSVTLEELVQRNVIGVPVSHTAREALDGAVLEAGVAYSQFLEAGNGTIAQALAAAGRGVAVVTDDSRFDLTPLAIEHDGQALGVRLIAAWDPTDTAVRTWESLATRIASWIHGRYRLQ